VRYNPDGSHDYSFGNGGKVMTHFGSTVDKGEAVTIQADGKILVAGSSSQNYMGLGVQIAIARYEGISTRVDELEGLVVRVQELQSAEILNDGQARSLQAKLQAAIQQVDRGNHGAAVNQLGAFMNHVDAFVSEGLLSSYEGQVLKDEAQIIIELLSI
jgi:large exoprotein involved in heme utilization and adhesion